PTADTTATAPAPLSPADGAFFPWTFNQGTADVLLTWSAVTDPSGVQDYELQVSPNPDFLLNVDNQSTSLDLLFTTATQFDINFPGFFNVAGVYYWRVRTLDGVNTFSPWSATRSFTVGTPPAAFVSALAVAPGGVPGGATAQGTVVLTRPAPAGGVSVA